MNDAIGSLAGNVEKRDFPRGDGAEEGGERDDERELEGVRKRVEKEEGETVVGFIEGEIESVLEGKHDMTGREGIVCGLFRSLLVVMSMVSIGVISEGFFRDNVY